MAAHSPPPFSSFLAPRYWLTWAGILLLCLIAWLPFRLRMASGKLLGLLTFRFARERRYITAINIEWCFPELNAGQQAELVKRCFIENGIGLIETATGWVRPPEHFLDQVVLIGTEHLDAVLAQGKGVLMLGAHYSTLDFGANLLSVHYPFAVTYRAHKNPLFDAFMLRGRLSNCNGVFDRKDIRGAFKHLRQGKILWYAPDQDYGPEQAVFVPFFGHPAATITAATRFASFNGSPVILVRQQRVQHKGQYVLEFFPLSPPLPTGDNTRDAQLINAALERAIRVEPAQYLWMHKRFKTQVGGKPDSPYIQIKTPRKKLSEQHYAGLLDQARPVAGADADASNAGGHNPWLLLKNGLTVREFPAVPRGLLRHRHPALRLDRLSKQLRSSGVRTLTIDNIFHIKARNLTALTCFLPPGAPLARQHVAPETAARFLAQLHGSGFHFRGLAAANLVVDENAIGILDPLQVCKVPGTTAWHARRDDLLAWIAITNCGTIECEQLREHYLACLRPSDAVGMRALLAPYPGLAHNAPPSPAFARTGSAMGTNSGTSSSTDSGTDGAP